MSDQIMLTILAVAVLSFGIGHGVCGPLLKHYQVNPIPAMILKHAITFVLLFVLGIAAMYFTLAPT